MLHLVGAMLTHPGAARIENQDTVMFALPDHGIPATKQGALMLVADGMGGHSAGALASALAAETIHHSFHTLEGSAPEVLGISFANANAAIFRRANEEADCAGMGTTCTVLMVRDGQVFLGHVGDSRAYMLRNGHLRQLSTDHSLVGELVRRGSMSPSEAAASPERHILLRALGTEAELDPEVWRDGLPLLPGDRLILCSDGLTDLVSDERIGETIADELPYLACERLITTALDAGGHDNISVGVFCVQHKSYDQAAGLIRATKSAGA